MIKRLIFDVDGTLITGVDFKSSIRNALSRLGINSSELVDKFINNIKNYEKRYDNYNRKDYLNFFSEVLGVTLDISFLDMFFDQLRRCVPKKDERLIKCISELSLNYDLVLLTNYFGESQMNRLDSMGIGKYFSHCYGEDLIKPNVDSYISACGNYKPYECVIIGDDLDLDVIVPKSLGLNTIYVGDSDFSNAVRVINVCDINSEFIENIFN